MRKILTLAVLFVGLSIAKAADRVWKTTCAEVICLFPRLVVIPKDCSEFTITNEAGGEGIKIQTLFVTNVTIFPVGEMRQERTEVFKNTSIETGSGWLQFPSERVSETSRLLVKQTITNWVPLSLSVRVSACFTNADFTNSWPGWRHW